MTEASAACNIDGAGARKRLVLGNIAVLAALGSGVVLLGSPLLGLIGLFLFTWLAGLCLLQAREKV